MRIQTYLFLFSLLLAAGCATTELPVVEQSQMPYPEPFQDANVIYVETDDDRDTAYDKVSRMLVMQDWDLSQTDSYWIATEPRGFGGGAVRIFADYHPDDSLKIELYARWIQAAASDRHQFMQYESRPVAARGERLSTTWTAWQHLVDTAQLYADGDTYFGIK